MTIAPHDEAEHREVILRVIVHVDDWPFVNLPNWTHPAGAAA